MPAALELPGPFASLPLGAAALAVAVGFGAGLVQRRTLVWSLGQGVKAAVGLATLWVGGAAAVVLLNPLAAVIEAHRGFYGGFPEDNALLGALLGRIGVETLLVLVLGTLFNLALARWTPLRSVVLTGHMIFSLAATVVLVLVLQGWPEWAVVVVGGAVVGLVEAGLPWLLAPLVRAVVGERMALGFWASSVVLLPAAVAARWWPERTDAEAHEALGGWRWLAWVEPILADPMIGIAVSSGAAYAVAVSVWGPIEVLGHATGVPEAILLGALVAGAMAAMLAGLQGLVGTYVPAIQHLAERWSPQHVPALDIPVLWVAPRGAVPGTAGCLVGAVGAAALTLAFGPYAILPGTIGIYFLGRSAGHAAVALGGSRWAAAAAGAVTGLSWPILAALFFPQLGLPGLAVAGFAISSSEAVLVAWGVLEIGRWLGIGA